MSFEPLIKWTGSKRYAAAFIADRLPAFAGDYWEPMLGGASLARELHDRGRLADRRIRLSDVCRPLMDLWAMLQRAHPDTVLKNYTRQREQLLKRGPAFYDQVREEFNARPEPHRFLFLLRTSYNGLVRFNLEGRFNATFHHNRSGIAPEHLRKVLSDWQPLLRRAELACADFATLRPREGDLVFVDPPYIRATHQRGFSPDTLWRWLDGLPCAWALTYDRQPGVGFSRSFALPRSVSGFSKLKQDRSEESRERLYLGNC